MDFTNYFGRLSCKGKTARERMIFDVHRDMMMKAETNPSYKTVDVDGEELHVLITSTQTVTAKNVVAMPGENFETGSIMIYNGSHWLITQRDLEDDVNIRGKIELCQREVIWQNQETGEIHRRWATVEKPYYCRFGTDLDLAIFKEISKSADCYIYIEEVYPDINSNIEFTSYNMEVLYELCLN